MTVRIRWCPSPPPKRCNEDWPRTGVWQFCQIPMLATYNLYRWQLGEMVEHQGARNATAAHVQHTCNTVSTPPHFPARNLAWALLLVA